MDVGEVTWLTRNEVKEFVSGVWSIEDESREMESQSEEGWDF